MSALQSLAKADFQAEVTDFKGVVLIDFWAAWCGPCRIMTPVVEKLAEKYADNDKVKFLAVDVDAESELSQEHSILSIPTFLVFANGEVVDQKIGVVAETELESAVQAALAGV